MAAILFDLDGVLYEGNTPIAGAADSINWCIKNHIAFLFLTNTTTRSRTELVSKLSRFHISSTTEQFLTPSVAANQWLHSNHQHNIALYIPEACKNEFSTFNIVTSTNHPIDAVIVGDLGMQWTFSLMNQVFQRLINKPAVNLLALGMTRYWKTEHGLQMDAGPVIKALEYATGKEAVVTGKPAARFFQAAIHQLPHNDGIIMIGDDIRSDIEAAQRIGLKTILVRTGKYTDQDLHTGIMPDAILDSIADLPAWWQNNIKTNQAV